MLLIETEEIKEVRKLIKDKLKVYYCGKSNLEKIALGNWISEENAKVMKKLYSLKGIDDTWLS